MQQIWRRGRVRVFPWALAILAVALVGLGVARVAHALTAEQCTAFEEDGEVQLCHATNSAKNPYVPETVSEQGCINGHAEQHPADYIAGGVGSSLYDPQCQGGGCLPEGAPCDDTLPCCEGQECTARGVCIPTNP